MPSKKAISLYQRSNSHSQINVKAILRTWKKVGPLNSRNQVDSFLIGVSLLARNTPPKPSPLELMGQPFDRHLLCLSPLYKKSRSQFLSSGGTFYPSFISSPRTLSSASLLSQEVEYSPVERELIWAVHNPIQKRNKVEILRLRTSITSLYHEQNHRILWHLLPAAPHSKHGLRRYLNFIESLVIILDMALSDDMREDLASLFYHLGVIYDPGTSVKGELNSKRLYRNYLQAALYATYLNLEHYEIDDIYKIIRTLFPLPDTFADRASLRATRLDREFVLKTNPIWQYQHRKQTIRALCSDTRPTLDLSNDPFDNRLHYLWTEKWLDLMGI